MSKLRLDLIVRTYGKPGLDIGGRGVDRWTWRLWSGSRVVSSSCSQRFSRRIDCARGAEVGAGLHGVMPERGRETVALRYGGASVGWLTAKVRILDERTP